MVWSTGEVLTVGSSIAAVTDAERAYMLVTRIISGVTYAYLLGAHSQHMSAISASSHQSKIYAHYAVFINDAVCSQLRLEKRVQRR